MKTNRNKITKLTQLSLLLALLIILAFTPLGFIIIPPVAITIMHLPVIIGSFSLGPVYGSILGAAFGIISMIKASTSSVSPIDMLFSPIASGFPLQSIVLCMVPRIVLGILPAVFEKGIIRMVKKDRLSIGISAALATACHTILVLGFLWAFFKSIPFQAVFLTVISLNGTIEIALAVIISVGVCIPLKKFLEKRI